MDRPQDLETASLEVEVAKLRLRVAAEKAEPARLLRQQVARSPLPSVGTALLAGLMLGRRSPTGAGTRTGSGLGGAPDGVPGGLSSSGLGAALVSQLLDLVTRAGSEWRR